MGKTVSVIVPVFNVEPYLARCLDSLVKQTVRPLEVVLVNDGSTDRSREVCERYVQAYPEMFILIDKDNGGLSSARNLGIEYSRGEFISFVDSDDWISSDCLETMSCLQERFNADIVSVGYTFSEGEIAVDQPLAQEICFDCDDAALFYLESGMKSSISEYPAWSKLYRKSLFEEVKFPEGQLYEDVATNMQLILRASKYAKTNKVCYYYFQRRGSITKSIATKRDWDLVKIGEDLVALTEHCSQEVRDLANQKLARGYFSFLCKLCLYGYSGSKEEKASTCALLKAKCRENYKLLMSSKMPLSRKAVLSCLVLSTQFSSACFFLARKILSR